MTIHGFRHSHATNLINNGVNIVSVSKRLGHSNIQTTLNVYTHLLDSKEETVIETIDNL
ncbi:tyrosine-type recombinase/integrase [Erysipelothrix sp. HDW6B]|nr:tyrosine-type recombinase/integrase [Erysipelothrix sp. HDW6B]